ncbi:MAG: GAF domain-containing protein [Anaerolineae bacterium]|nr:GAF domain-containing protein [Anaerolineae bacterium]
MATVNSRAMSGIEEVRAWQRRLLQGVLRALAIITLVAVVTGTVDSVGRGQYWTVPFYWVSYAVIILFALWRRAPYQLGAWSVIVLLYVQGFIDVVQDGLSGSARVFMLTLVFAAAIFLGRRASIFALALAVLTLAGFGVSYTTGWLTVPGVTGVSDPTAWIVATATFLMLGVLVAVSLNFMVPRLATALGQSRQLAQELEAERVQLESQVKERTADLARRTVQLETAAEVARDAGAIRDVERLLAETARLISARFGFYHTGIFLLDEKKEYAVLRAASSAGGQRMMARGHKLEAGDAPVGIVGEVAARGGAHIALDTGADAVFFDNPDLPETRSELALPLQARGERIGVLDVQSTEPDAFGPEDVAVLQTLADQVAVAISNARLYQQAQASLEAERRAYGELSAKGWQELARLGGTLRRRYDPHGVLTPEQHRHLAPEGGAGQGGMAIPIRVRGQVIGTLDAYKPAGGGPAGASGAGEWTEEEKALLGTLADQLGAALDSARLYQETERRAAQERLVGEVTARMRQSLDVDAVLRTAAQEIGESLGLHDLAIRLEVGSE